MAANQVGHLCPTAAPDSVEQTCPTARVLLGALLSRSILQPEPELRLSGQFCYDHCLQQLGICFPMHCLQGLWLAAAA